MTPQGLRKLVARWERGMPPSEEELRQLQLLEADDPPLYARISPLLPLMRRDAGAAIEIEVPAPELEGRVLERLPRRSGYEEEPEGRSTWAPRWLLQAAAAVVLVGLGLVIGLSIATRSQGAPNTVVVRFELADPQARSVAVVGDFNDWQPQSLEMHKVKGVWELSVPLRRGDVYTYNFLIDGRTWISDPSSLYRIRDGFGGEKSVLQL